MSERDLISHRVISAVVLLYFLAAPVLCSLLGAFNPFLLVGGLLRESWFLRLLSPYLRELGQFSSSGFHLSPSVLDDPPDQVHHVHQTRTASMATPVYMNFG